MPRMGVIPYLWVCVCVCVCELNNRCLKQAKLVHVKDHPQANQGTIFDEQKDREARRAHLAKCEIDGVSVDVRHGGLVDIRSE